MVAQLQDLLEAAKQRMKPQDYTVSKLEVRASCRNATVPRAPVAPGPHVFRPHQLALKAGNADTRAFWKEVSNDAKTVAASDNPETAASDLCDHRLFAA